ncbi:MAG TPA: MauE/DoxX family redox-associated membrane protein [Propionicimonas sp.]|jgi:uncharacterized membrane protein|uniref:DoxX family protein n=1 Tax=Propionicimonas sp. TaxID=1955623 RepID=UPI002F3E9758
MKLPSTSDGTRQAYVMGSALIAMGVLHFAAPKGFDSIIPAEIGVPARTLTYVSGAAELAIGTGLLAPRTRKVAALAAIALFVAVFPANINTVRVFRDKPIGYRLGAIARLPLQVPMITSAWQVFARSR